MLRGEKLFQALKPSHPLCSKLPASGNTCCFETFPHAITWHLTDGKSKAKIKRTQRRSLLAKEGIALDKLTNIDLVDAALCALTAHLVAAGGECLAYGERSTGLIIVPRSPKP
jgi:predicted nuclease with RNAse H fold